MFLLFVGVSLASTWTVDAAGGGDFESVQAAIDASASGDTLEIAGGTYLEGIDLGGKSLTLTGDGSGSTTIGFSTIDVCLTVESGETLVASGLSFAGCSTLVQASGATLWWTDVGLWGSEDAGDLDGVDLSWVGGELAYLEGDGLSVDGSTVTLDGVTFSGNEVSDTLVRFSACTVEMSAVEVSDNTVEGHIGGEAAFEFDGGTAIIDGLDAHDNRFEGFAVGVLSVDGGAEVEVSASSFADNSAVTNGSIATIADGVLWTSGSTVQDTNYTAIWASSGDARWYSSGDAFTATGATATPAAFSVGQVDIDGSSFLDYPSGTVLGVAGSSGLDMRDATLSEGFLYLYGGVHSISDSTLEGWLHIESGATVGLGASTFTGTRGTAFELRGGATVTLTEVDVSGYALAFDGSATVMDSRFTGLTRFAELSDGELSVSESTIETTGDGIVMTGGSLVLDGVAIDSAGVGLDYDGEAWLTDTSIRADGEGIIVQSGSSLVAVGLDVESTDAAISIAEPTSRRERQNVDVSISDGRLLSSGADGVWGGEGGPVELHLADTTIGASKDGIYAVRRVDAVLDNVEIVADEVGLTFHTAGVVVATDLVVDSAGDAFSGLWDWTQAGGSITTGGEIGGADDVVLSDVILASAREGLVASTFVGTNIEITSGGSCLRIDRGPDTIVGLTCASVGGRPLDFVYYRPEYELVLTEVQVLGSSSAEPSRISGASATLSNVRFWDNTTSSGAGALEITESVVTADRLHFEGNEGVSAGALSIVDSEVSIRSSVFRGNLASAGPGAVRDDAGASFTCSIFQENEGSAGDLLVGDEDGLIRNCTMVGSAATTGTIEVSAGYVAVDSSLIAFAPWAAGLYAAEDIPTAWILYNDVYGNVGGNYGGAMSDPTGQLGNLSVDPLFVAFSLDGNPTNDDLHLATGSSAIDAGNPASVDADGSRADMGAYALDCGANIDFDGDGQLVAEGDCDDAQALAWEGAAEVPCDGVDNDCAGDGDDPDCGGDSGDTGDTGGDGDSGNPDDTDVGDSGVDDSGDGGDDPVDSGRSEEKADDQGKEGCGGCASTPATNSLVGWLLVAITAGGGWRRRIGAR